MLTWTEVKLLSITGVGFFLDGAHPPPMIRIPSSLLTRLLS
jgi:hypothetical protein